MTRTFTGCALVLAWLASAAPQQKATIWNVIAVDAEGDGRESTFADAAQLSYRYDAELDMLWFRVSVFSKLNADGFSINIAVDTGADAVDKTNWWGGNVDFTFDRLITADVTRTGGTYTGTIGISDAAGARQKQLTNLRQNNLQLTIDRDAILVGVKRSDLSSGMKMNLVAAVGSSGQWSDDVPNLRSAAIDLAAPRPVRGLREIDVSRNNLRFGPRYQTLTESQRPRVVRHGRGGRPLILVPGVYSGDAVFDGFIARNESRYTLHVVSPPGLNGTPARPLPPENVSYGERPWTRQLARDLLAVIDEQRLEKPIIVTHGFPGSLAAEELAVSHPDRLGGIIEIASMPLQFAPSLKHPGGEAAPDERVAIVDANWVRQWFKYVTPETWESNNYSAAMFANDPARAERARQQTESVPLEVKIRYLVEFMASDQRAQVGKSRVPILAVIPGFDEKTLADPANSYFKAAFQDAWKRFASPCLRMETIPDARALILDDQPARADAAIAAFVDAASRAKDCVIVDP
jgi:pimeloyl-ACP methyl ester carboxylesterase